MFGQLPGDFLSGGESNSDSPTAVFTELLFDKTSKITKGIPVGIFKGFSAVLAESSL